ncbi:hypothetical protein D3C87_95200 [compost metagenome]
MLNLFKNNQNETQKEWYEKGEKYAVGINEMVAFAEKNGWENWTGEEPVDNRENLGEKVFELLKKANANNEIARFREQFPPAHTPLISLIEKKAQSIEQLQFIADQKILFVRGTAYQNRQAYLLDGDKVMELDESIDAVGKSKQGNVFAIAAGNKITTVQGWEGEIIHEFELIELANTGITELYPFNDGKKMVVVTSEGIYLVSAEEEKLIHPVREENEENDEEEWSPDIDMENAALSNDNRYILVGDQSYDHRLLDADGNTLGAIGPQSSYPHFCLFAKDDSQVISNSCHFYNGMTIGVNSDKFENLNIEAYSESEDYTEIDDQMRVYAGVAVSNYYILGDAYGYIKAFDKTGKPLWRHFLGSTISGMAISDDEKTLWVGSSSGILHKLQLEKGHRDTHVIGNGNHYEEFRLLIWKDEKEIWKW